MLFDVGSILAGRGGCEYVSYNIECYSVLSLSSNL